MDTFQNLTGRIKRTPQNLKCSVCAREFLPNRKADLDRHMRIHTNEKPFKCTFEGCDKAFKQSSALKIHVNVHTKEQRYFCDVCERSFCDKPTRNRHKKEQHTMSYVFQCPFPECGNRKIKRRDTFRKHVSSKHHTYISDEDCAKYRVRYSPNAVKAAVNKGKLAHSQVADAGQLLPAASISSSPVGRAPSTSSAHSSGSYSPTSNGVTLRNPYASQHSPTPARQLSPRYGTPVDYPQMNGGSPYSSSQNIGYGHSMYGNTYLAPQGMAYSPAHSPASLTSCISSSSGTSSSSSSLHSNHGSPRPIISRSNSLSPSHIDPLLCGVPVDPYGKVAPAPVFVNYMNNGFVAPNSLHY
ncbi:hypothetical protein SCHPADRAFT_935052 [Schizopora paradoxa]|uniref:C2H2-type domain-containing protein n=1 Tax=Schizopora paradoxa TaxID=27342 RepID=A0A0H2SE15_9AGAM|nr:hypothetical protein SCHPADRAFT_935052 [Schizopora paradoxa]